MTRPNFHADLKRGQLGEIAFQKLAEANGVLLTRTDGKSGDFRNTSTGEKIELKTDSYSMAKTSNFFIETFSDVDKGKKGGPYQALDHGCEKFVYFFINDMTAFVFDTKSLIDQIARLSGDQVSVKEVKNVRWTTIGSAINRSLLTPLAVWKAK